MEQGHALSAVLLIALAQPVEEPGLIASWKAALSGPRHGMPLPHKHSKLRFRENYMTLRRSACATSGLVDAGLGHALQESASIDTVVVVVVKNES